MDLIIRMDLDLARNASLASPYSAHQFWTVMINDRLTSDACKTLSRFLPVYRDEKTLKGEICNSYETTSTVTRQHTRLGGAYGVNLGANQ